MATHFDQYHEDINNKRRTVKKRNQYMISKWRLSRCEAKCAIRQGNSVSYEVDLSHLFSPMVGN